MSLRKAKEEEARLAAADPEAFARLQRARQGAADMMNLFDANLKEMQADMVSKQCWVQEGEQRHMHHTDWEGAAQCEGSLAWREDGEEQERGDG